MMHKFGTAEVLSAALGSIPATASRRPLSRSAHRAVFQYQPRQGYLYVRSRAISSRCNLNYDDFPAKEIRSSWQTFVGKPVFVNHDNDDVVKARGVIIDAALHDDLTPDGADDTWVEVLMEVDATSFPKLAQSILNGDIERTSMGVDCEWSQCSVCDNVAFTEYDFCDHIPDMKGMTYQRADGEMVLVREIVGGLTFFENSLLVEDPADPTAHFLAVDDRGVGTGRYQGGLTRGASRKANQTMVDPFASAAESISAAGGTTVSTHGLPVPDSGYMVALPGREVVLPSDQLTPDAIRQYADTYRDDLASQDRFLGGWANENQVYLDVSDHTNDPVDAFTRGREREQKAIWDIGNEMEWPMDENEYTRAASLALPMRRFYIGIDPDDYDADELAGFLRSLCQKAGTMNRQAMRRRAFGERTAPAQIETLGRDNVCPVCSEASAAFDGEQCLVCGYIAPPDIFQDPNLAEAGDLDALREGGEVDEFADEFGDEAKLDQPEQYGEFVESEDADPDAEDPNAEDPDGVDELDDEIADSEMADEEATAPDADDEFIFEEKPKDESEPPKSSKDDEDEDEEDEALFE